MGALSGSARDPRATMKVCSSAYWPRSTAWLTMSVRTSHVAPGAKLWVALAASAWYAWFSLRKWWKLSMNSS